MYDTLDIFPIPVGLYNIDIEDTSIDYIKTLQFGSIDSDQSSMSISQQVLNDPKLEYLKLDITKCINHYLEPLNHRASKIEIVSSWINKFTKNQIILPHMHSNCYVAGSLYFSEGSELVLRPPTIDTLFGINTEFTKTPDIVKIKPTKGKLILFPGKLIHNVEPATSERFSLAFNTWPKEYGYPAAEVRL